MLEYGAAAGLALKACLAHELSVAPRPLPPMAMPSVKGLSSQPIPTT